MKMGSYNYMLTNEKSGNSCIFIEASHLWTEKKDSLYGMFKRMEQDLGISEIEIKFTMLSRKETFREIRLRRILCNLFPETDNLDLVYLSKERN